MALTQSNAKKVADLDTPDTDPTLSRRRFLSWGIYGIGGAVTAALAVPAVGYLFTSASSSSDKIQSEVGSVPIGAAADLASATFGKDPKVQPVTYSYTDEFKQVSQSATVFVQALNQNPSKPEDFRVLSSICTHLGCIINIDTGAKKFACPCHGSVFEYDGTVAHGPANKPLNRYDVKLTSDGKVAINPLQIFG